MKFTFWNRLWAALAGLIIFVIGINSLVFSIGLIPFKIDAAILNGPFLPWQRIVMVVGSLLLCALGLNGIWMLFHRRGEKGFIMQHTDLGDMSISMNALETMVHKCVDQHKELWVKATRIFRIKNGIAVEIRIVLAPAVNIPLTVSALQKQIKQYITSCSGVEVREVKVLVETAVAKQHFGKEQRELVVDVRGTASPTASAPSVLEKSVESASAPVWVKSEPVAAATSVEEAAHEDDTVTFEPALPVEEVVAPESIQPEDKTGDMKIPADGFVFGSEDEEEKEDVTDGQPE